MSYLKKFSIIGLALIFVACKNLSGKAAWDQFQQDQEAKGISFDYQNSFPAKVPSEKNFAHTPLLKPLLAHQWNAAGTEVLADPPEEKTERANQLMKFEGTLPSLGQWRTGQRIDLAQWQKYFRDQPDWPHPETAGRPGADILHALKKQEGDLAELTQAMTERPLCRFDIRYEATFGALLPHVQVLRNAGRGSALRSLAHLAEDQPDAALTDLELTLHLAECFAEEPLLISQLVRFVILENGLQVIWEGLADHQWQAQHLAALEKRLAKIQTLAGFDRAMTLERNAANFLVQDMIQNGGLKKFTEITGEKPRIPDSVTPSDWLSQNLLNLNQLHLKYTHQIVDAKTRRVHIQVASDFVDAVDSMKRNPYNVLSSLMLPALSGSAVRTGAAQGGVDLALLAVRLEQHRLQHGAYPKTLTELKGKQPADIYTGNPYTYERNEARYALRGPGSNAKDDAGQVVTQKNSKQIDFTKGDVVWLLPAR